MTRGAVFNNTLLHTVSKYLYVMEKRNIFTLIFYIKRILKRGNYVITL